VWWARPNLAAALQAIAGPAVGIAPEDFFGNLFELQDLNPENPKVKGGVNARRRGRSKSWEWLDCPRRDRTAAMA
jgi:hypothetical protein